MSTVFIPSFVASFTCSFFDSLLNCSNSYKMKLAVTVLIFCCALAVQAQTPTRPNFFATLINAIFRRRPSPQQQLAAAEAAAQTNPLAGVDLSQLLNNQAVQQQPEIFTKFVTETATTTETETITSSIPSLERITSVETIIEQTVQTIYETVKVTEVMTDHTTITATACPSSVASKDAVSSSSAAAKPSKAS